MGFLCWLYKCLGHATLKFKDEESIKELNGKIQDFEKEVEEKDNLYIEGMLEMKNQLDVI